MTTHITVRQGTILSFVKEHIKQHGYPPTIREIAAHLNITSLKAVDRHLEALKNKGHIKRAEGISRAIEVIGYSAVSNIRNVPIIGTVRAGAPTLAIENIQGHIAMDSSIAKSDGSFFLRVKGESMIDAQIKDGDLALVQPASEIVNGDIVVALIGDEATLKLFYKEQDKIRLQPANSLMKPILVKDGDTEFSILGKVVGVFRESHNITRNLR